MIKAEKTKPSLESLIESEDLGIEVLHPGGLEITGELAKLCRIGKDSRVLDVASGTGESACYLAETTGARITGIDFSETMIARSMKKAAEKNLDVTFIKGDAHQLPFEDNTFDAVISECTTCSLNKEQAIREMARVVKPEGYVGIHDICWKPGAPEKIKLTLDEIEGERPETLEGWKSLFEIQGLVDVAALDKSILIPEWIADERKMLGLSGVAKVYGRVLRRWGLSGVRDIYKSEQIFRSEFMGYGIIAGKNPGVLSVHSTILLYGSD